MNGNKLYVNWRLLIISIALILGLLAVRGLVIRDRRARNVDELILALTSKGYKSLKTRDINLPKELKELAIPEMKKNIAIDKLSISVMVFADEQTANAALELISEDGNKMGHRYSHYTHRAHIYQSGEIIVMYIGRNLKTQWDLRDILGRQVKGSKWWEEPLAPVITKLYDIINY